jgi:hypothetical protein
VYVLACGDAGYDQQCVSGERQDGTHICTVCGDTKWSEQCVNTSHDSGGGVHVDVESVNKFLPKQYSIRVGAWWKNTHVCNAIEDGEIHDCPTCSAPVRRAWWRNAYLCIGMWTCIVVRPLVCQQSEHDQQSTHICACLWRYIIAIVAVKVVTVVERTCTYYSLEIHHAHTRCLQVVGEQWA